jgi:hypothetical protein
MKSCVDCKYSSLPWVKYPCSPCHDHENFEPEEDIIPSHVKHKKLLLCLK